MAALFVGQFSLIGISPDFQTTMQNTLANIATLAALSDSMKQLADTWATEFSKNALALTSGAFVLLKNQLEQVRDASFIVARVPLVPLYLLLGFKLLYVVAVIALAIGAYAFTHPAETEVVKAQLSTKGLAAAHFDQPALVQENAVKAVQSRLGVVNERSATDPPSTSNSSPDNNRPGDPKPGNLKRAITSLGEIAGGKPKVGSCLMQTVPGDWWSWRTTCGIASAPS
jgi:hypothetical protein